MTAADGGMPSATFDYALLTDPTYVPSLAEVQEALADPEGEKAITAYHQVDPRTGQYEMWTREYIAGLSDYIVRTLIHYDQPSATVLEVGAGHGRLSGLLRQNIGARGLDTLVVATDIKPPRETHFPVETLSCKQALQEYEPTIVLSSWMLSGHDWTKAMRRTPSVLDYILIGVPKITATPEAWQGYDSPEAGQFAPIELSYLDALKDAQVYLSEEIDLTRGFRRYTNAQPEAASSDENNVSISIR